MTAITIYSSARPGAIPADWYRPLPGQGTPPATQLPGYAVVRTDRDLAIQRGRSQLKFTDVAALIDPTTVSFQSLTDPAGTRVLEQNFQFDLVSTQKLLSRYVDRPVTIERPQGDGVSILNGTLLSAYDGLVVRGDDGQIHALNQWSGIRFGELPGGLITQPTLEWDLSAAKGGTHRVRTSYQTGGITWWTDYNLLFTPGADANSGFVDVGAWVSIINQSGAAYPGARLKLIAGEVNRAQPAAAPYAKGRVAMSMEMADAARLRGEGILRVSPVHPRPADDAAQQFDQADRAVRRGESRAGQQETHLLRCPRLRLGWLAGDRPRLRPRLKQQGRRLAGVPQ